MPDLHDMTVDELEDEAFRRNVDIDTIEGTGADGAVLKTDLLAALTATQPPAPTDIPTIPDGPARTPLADVAVQRARRPVRDRSAMFPETQE